MIFSRFLVKRRRLMMDIANSEQLSPLHRLGSFADQHAVHKDIVSDAEVLHREFVFGRNA